MAAPKKKNKLLNIVATDENAAPPKMSLKEAMMAGNRLSKSTNKATLASKVRKIDVIPTGILALDYALRIGGFPRGRIIQLYGNEGSWKSTVCLRTIAEAQKRNGTAIWIDAERTFEPSWAEQNGVNLEQLGVITIDTAEEALNQMEFYARSGIDVIVLDSLAALAPHKELFTDENKTEYQTLEKEHMAIFPRLMSKFLRRSTNVFANNNTLVLFVNQLRASLSQYGSPTSVPGGKALAYYNTISVNLKRVTGKEGQILDKKTGDPIGAKYEFRVDKTKFDITGQSGGMTVYGNTIDNYTTLRDLAIKEKIIVPAVNEETGKELQGYFMVGDVKVHGKDKIQVELAKNKSLLQTIETQVRAKMGFFVRENLKENDPDFEKAEELSDAELDAIEAELEAAEGTDEEAE